MVAIGLLFALASFALAKDAPTEGDSSQVAFEEDVPGCTNVRFVGKYLVADCVDDVTGTPFYYFDTHGKFNAAYEDPTLTPEELADAIFVQWTTR